MSGVGENFGEATSDLMPLMQSVRNVNLRIGRRMKSVAPIPMPPNSGRSAERMMRGGRTSSTG